MSKLTQKELITEGFLDTVRALGAATKQVFKTVMPNTAQAIGDIRDKAMAVKGAYTKQIPLSFLKDILKKRTDIEFIEFIKQEQRTANPKKPWYRKIYGPKNVTLITFTATVYHKGTVRDYKMYKEAVGRGLPRPNDITLFKGPSTGIKQYKPKNSKTGLGPSSMRQARGQVIDSELGPPSMRQARGRVIDVQGREDDDVVQDDGQPKEPIVDTLTAEIFRTSEGLQLGDIYSTKTGRMYYTEKEKALPVFNNVVVKYRDSATGDYTVKSLVVFLQREIGLRDSMAKNIVQSAQTLSELISRTTGVTNDLNAVVPAVSLNKLRAALHPLYVESSNKTLTNKNKQMSQLTLLEQISNLR